MSRPYSQLFMPSRSTLHSTTTSSTSAYVSAKEGLRKKLADYKSKVEQKKLTREGRQGEERSETPLPMADMGIEVDLMKMKLRTKKLEHENTSLTSSLSRANHELKKLKHENAELKKEVMCTICGKNKRQVVFLPCGHFVSCTVCSDLRNSTACILCYVPISGKMVIYK